MSEPEPTFQTSLPMRSPKAGLFRCIQILFAVFFIYWILWFPTAVLFLDYLPSHEWLKAIEPYYIILEAAAALITPVILFLGFQTEQFRKAHQENESRIISAAIFIAFTIYFPTTDLMWRGIPAMIAVGWGEQVEHQYFILDPDKPHPGRGRCDREIVLRDMPVLTMLCNMPSEFHDQLQAGTSVVFIGKGTWMGLFVEDFRKP